MIGRHQFGPNVAIEARPAPGRPGYSWLAVLLSPDDGETWGQVLGPPFTGPSEYGPDMATVKCWPNQHLDAVVDWHLAHIALESATVRAREVE